MASTLRTAVLVPLLALFLAAGCAGLQETAEDAPEPEPEDTAATPEEPEPDEPDPAAALPEPEPEPEPEPRPRGLTGDNLYRLLVAEMAGKQGDLDAALAGYLETARDTRDPRVAERAARTALYLERNDAAIEAAERWVELRPESREPHSMLARLYLLAGDPDRAAVHMLAVIDYSPDHATGLREVAALAGRIEDPLVVNAAIDQVLEEYPDAPVLHYTMAFQAAEAGDHDAALERLGDALAIDPDYTRALLLRAEVLAVTDRENEAVDLLADARERMPGDRDLALGEIRLFIEIGDRDAAIRRMQEAFERFGNDGYAVNTLALTAMRVGALDDARIYFQRQLAMDGKPDEARYYLGRIAQDQGDCEEAMSQYIQVTDQDYRFDAQQRFATCLAAEGRIDEARMHVERLRQAYHSDEARHEIMRTRAEIERNAGNLDQALTILSTGVDARPDNEDLRYMRAMFAAEAGHFELARDDLEWMLERNPDAPHVQNALGYTLADEGVELERARDLVERALAQRPEDAAVLDSMGWVLYRKGEHERALEYLRAAWERSPDAEIGAHLGEVLWVLGERGEAREIWNAAAEDDPDDRVLRETLERLRE